MYVFFFYILSAVTLLNFFCKHKQVKAKYSMRISLKNIGPFIHLEFKLLYVHLKYIYIYIYIVPSICLIRLELRTFIKERK